MKINFLDVVAIELLPKLQLVGITGKKVKIALFGINVVKVFIFILQKQSLNFIDKFCEMLHFCSLRLLFVRLLISIISINRYSWLKSLTSIAFRSKSSSQSDDFISTNLPDSESRNVIRAVNQRRRINGGINSLPKQRDGREAERSHNMHVTY